MPPETISRILSMTDFVAFERMCCDLLASYGSYAGIVPQGVGRIDGGKDAILSVREHNCVTVAYPRVIFHFSLRQNYASKLEEDLSSVRKHGHSADLIVFVTSQRCSAKKQDELKKKTWDGLGWDLEIYDQEWLRVPLDGEYQRLRKTYLGLDYDEHVFAPLDTILKNRARHPNRDDFEQQAYYRDVALQARIGYLLDTYRSCLVIGNPGSGKTALARAIGYDLQSKDCQHIVLYVSARVQPAYDQWLKHIHAMDHTYVTFILDDCHAEIAAVNEVVARLSGIERARILLVSRSIESDQTGPTNESYLEAFESRVVRIEPDIQRIEEIINAILRRERVIGRDPGPLESVLDRCQGDLHLVEFLVAAWIRESTDALTLAQIPDDRILDDVYRRYLAPASRKEQICSLAALAQFEIPAASDWLGDQLVIEDLRADAFVETAVLTPRGAPIEFLEYFHSTPARWIVRAALAKGILKSTSEDQFLIREISRYIASGPPNFFEIFHRTRARLDIQAALFDGPIAIPEAQRQAVLLPNEPPEELMKSFFLFLFAIWRWEEKRPNGRAYQMCKRFFEQFTDANHEILFSEFGLQTLSLCMSVGRVYPEIRAEVLKTVNFEALGKRSAVTGVSLVSVFLSRARQAEVPKIELAKFCSSLDFEKLGKSSQTVGLSIVRNFLYNASQSGVDAQTLNAFCTGIDFQGLGKRSQGVGPNTVRVFLQITRQLAVKPQMLNAFCRGLDFKALGVRSKHLGLANIRRFIELVHQSGIEPKILNAYCIGLDFEALGRRSRTVGFSTVVNFLDLARRSEIDDVQLQAFCRELDYGALGERAYQVKSGRVMNFLLRLARLRVGERQREEFLTGWEKGSITKITDGTD